MAVDVTPGLNEKMPEVQGLIEILNDHILPEMEKASGQTVVLVTCRLNSTSLESPSPVWAGWAESQALQQRTGSKGSPPEGLIGKDHASPIYIRCLTVVPQKDAVHSLNFSDPEVKAREKTPGSLHHDTNRRLNHRRYACIIARVRDQDRGVGTLTVGIPGRITSKEKESAVQRVLISWAQTRSNQVRYLTRSFNLGGPVIKAPAK